MLSLDQIIDAIMREKFLTRDEIMDRIGSTRALYGNTITEEGAAMIVANELGVVLETDPESIRPGRIAETIYAVLADLGPAWHGGIPVDEAKRAVEKRGILPHVFDSFIEGEKQCGRIYEPRPGAIRPVSLPHSRSTLSREEKNGGIGMGLEMEAERTLEDGAHGGKIVRVIKTDKEKEGRKFSYIDVHVLESSGVELRAGYPGRLFRGSALWKVLERFGATLKEGQKVDIEGTLLNKACTFVTVAKTGKSGGIFANIDLDSLKPLPSVNAPTTAS